MNRKLALLLIAGVAVILLSVGGAITSGFVPEEGSDSEEPVTATSTEEHDSDYPLAFEIEGSTECGLTCRRVNTTVTNQGDETLTDVRLEHELYTRDGDGNADEVAWDGSATVGAVEAGETAISRVEVEVDIDDGAAIKDRGGLLVTTMRSDAGNETIERVVRTD